jgi:nitroreductase
MAELYSHKVEYNPDNMEAPMNVSDAIRTKRAVRRYDGKPLPESIVRSILNAGRRAQSSKNSQAWRFIAIQDKGALKALSACGASAEHIAGSALTVAILTPEPGAKFQTMFDAGQAAAYMQLSAWELGVGSCPVSIYEPDKARGILGFPAEWHLRIALVFGYPAEATALDTPPKKGGRLAFDDVVHWERW